MNKLIIASLIVLLTACFAAHAGIYKESLYKDWRYPGESFVAKGRQFSVANYNYDDKVGIRYGDALIFVRNSSCRDYLDMNFCLLNLTESTKYFSNITHELMYWYHIQVHFYVAKMSVTRDITKTSIESGDTSKIKVKLKNIGSADSTEVVFNDSFPGFEIVSATNCDKEGDGVVWKGEIKKAETADFTYIIRGKDVKNYISAPEITYFDGVQTKKESSTRSTFSVTEPSINISLTGNKTISVGQQLTLFFKIKSNRNDSKSIGSARVELPASLKLISVEGDFQKKNNHAEWVGRLNPGTEKSAIIVLEAETSGVSTITAVVEFTTIAGAVKPAKDFVINVTIPSLQLIYKKFNDTFYSGDNIDFLVVLNNPTSYRFKNVRATATSNIIGFETQQFRTNDMYGGDFGTLLNVTILAPALENLTKYSLDLEMEYKSEYGEKFEIKDSKEIYVYPKKEEEPIEQNITEVKEEIKVEEKKKGFGVFNYVLLALLAFLIIALIINFIKKKKEPVFEEE